MREGDETPTRYNHEMFQWSHVVCFTCALKVCATFAKQCWQILVYGRRISVHLSHLIRTEMGHANKFVRFEAQNKDVEFE